MLRSFRSITATRKHSPHNFTERPKMVAVATFFKIPIEY
jgi:hypothetical protein